MHGQQRGAGPVSLGHKPDGTRIRRKVTGRTKTEVRDKLREVDSGLRPRRRYTVGDALEDWLAHGVEGLSARTVTLYRVEMFGQLDGRFGGGHARQLRSRRRVNPHSRYQGGVSSRPGRWHRRG